MPLLNSNPSVANDLFSLTTLAAAFAETGQILPAVQTQEHALDVARQLSADSVVIDDLASTAARYRERLVHLEPARP